MPIKCSIEILYHYNCSLCSKWWSVADIPSVLGQEMTCPHCGETGAIEEMKNGKGEAVEDVWWQQPDNSGWRFVSVSVESDRVSSDEDNP